jgi:DNA-binding GntR family transcriptional regulator
MTTGIEPGMKVSPIIRAPLRQEIRRVILERILRGALAPGSDVNEAMLAASLNVSRTPLREALLGLEMEGFLKSDVGRGFSVVPLTERDVEEIYPLLWTLESLALKTMGPVPPDTRRKLAELNTELEASVADADAALALDQSWHETLLAQCRNQHLLDLLGGLKDLAHRYELAYMKHSGKVILSVEQHRGVLSALERGDVEDAAAHLEANWRVSQEFLIPWIRGRGEDDARRKTTR